MTGGIEAQLAGRIAREGGAPDEGEGAVPPAPAVRVDAREIDPVALRAVQSPEVKTGMLRDGFVVSPIGPAEFQAFIRVKMQEIEKVARAAKIKAE